MITIGVVRIHFQPPEEPPIVTQGHFTFLAKQNDDHIEYFVKSDPYSVYNYLSCMRFERAESGALGRWQYRAILTNSSRPKPEGGHLIPNDRSSCFITVYENYIEIDGITYLFPEEADILDWFTTFYEKNVNDHPVYRSYD